MLLILIFYSLCGVFFSLKCCYLVFSTIFLYLFENTDYTCLTFNFSFILFLARQLFFMRCKVEGFTSNWRFSNFTIFVELLFVDLSPQSARLPLGILHSSSGPSSNDEEEGILRSQPKCLRIKVRVHSAIFLPSYHPFSYRLVLCCDTVAVVVSYCKQQPMPCNMRKEGIRT